MEKEKSVVEDALLQIKAIEEAISENAKGILASTMKQEISELVKESLTGRKNLHEQDEEEPEMGDEEEEVDLEMDDEEEPEMGDEEEVDFEEEDVEEPSDDFMSFDDDNQDEMPPLDLTQASHDEVLRVFKAMGDEDGIIIKKQDDGDIHLVDNNNDTEYLISMGGASVDSEPLDMMESYEEEDEDTIYELEMDEESEEDEEYVFEIDEDELKSVMESFKYSKKPNQEGGFDDKKKEAPKREGKGGNFKKDSYPSKMKHGVTETEMDEMEEGWMDEEEMDEMTSKDKEFKEAARTLGNGSRNAAQRKGLPKMKVKPQNESYQKEVEILKEKNEEYKKALDFLRNKLNEVAVFNSNLAYSTRLFTEHSTTKQEKINILRRFDNVETIKESKTLYKTIKEELGGTSNVTESINESVQRTVVKTPQTGSSSNLIESKTYENPQFLRMKDLMAKIK
jgi:hypothetical protein